MPIMLCKLMDLHRSTQESQLCMRKEMASLQWVESHNVLSRYYSGNTASEKHHWSLVVNYGFNHFVNCLDNLVPLDNFLLKHMINYPCILMQSNKLNGGNFTKWARTLCDSILARMNLHHLNPEVLINFKLL